MNIARFVKLMIMYCIAIGAFNGVLTIMKEPANFIGSQFYLFTFCSLVFIAPVQML